MRGKASDSSKGDPSLYTSGSSESSCEGSDDDNKGRQQSSWCVKSGETSVVCIGPRRDTLEDSLCDSASKVASLGNYPAIGRENDDDRFLKSGQRSQEPEE